MLFDGLSLTEGSSIGNATIAGGTSYPTNASAGELFFRTDLDELHLYDGSNWAPVGTGSGGALPDQTGNSGKFLSTNGSAASWETVVSEGLAKGSNIALNLGSSVWSVNNGETIVAGELITAGNANSRFMMHAGGQSGGMNLYVDGMIYASGYTNDIGKVWHLNLLGAGTSGQSLVSAGTGALPTWSYPVSRENVVQAVTASTTSTTINLQNGGAVRLGLNTASTTITFTNIPSSQFAVTLYVAQGTASGTIVWPSGTKWAGGGIPSITATIGKTDIYTLVTTDQGTTWFGSVVGQNY